MLYGDYTAKAKNFRASRGEQLRLDARMFVNCQMEHSQLALVVMKTMKQSSSILI